MEHTDISDKVGGSSDQERGYETIVTMPDYRPQKKAINDVVKRVIINFETGEAVEKKNKNTLYQSNRQKLYEGLELALESEGFGEVVESVRERLKELGQRVLPTIGGVIDGMEKLEPRKFDQLMNGRLVLPEVYVNLIAKYGRKREIMKQVLFGDLDPTNYSNSLIVIS